MPYGGGNLDSEASLASASTSSAAASFFDLAHAVHEALPDDVANVLRKFPQDRNDGDIRVVKMWLKHLPVSSVRRFLFVPGSVGNEIAQHLQLLAAGRDTLIYRQGEGTGNAVGSFCLLTRLRQYPRSWRQVLRHLVWRLRSLPQFGNRQRQLHISIWWCHWRLRLNAARPGASASWSPRWHPS